MNSPLSVIDSSHLQNVTVKFRVSTYYIGCMIKYTKLCVETSSTYLTPMCDLLNIANIRCVASNKSLLA